MTSEIAIMNMQAIALATDSAVTSAFERQGERDYKIFTSANKLFTLSKYEPVGVMVYGDASLMQVPWETVIKTYRSHLGDQRFARLQEYADDFIKFLENHRQLFPEAQQERFLVGHAYGLFGMIKQEIEEEVKNELTANHVVTKSQVEQIVSSVVERHLQGWEALNTLECVQGNYAEQIEARFSNKFDEVLQTTFQELPLSDATRASLRRMAVCLVLKDWFPENAAGVVIAGFGGDEAFPSLRQFVFHGVVNSKLKYKVTGVSAIDFNQQAAIVPFAQDEMVYTFMEGIDDAQRTFMEQYLSEVFDQYPEIIVDAIDGIEDDKKKMLRKKLKEISGRIFSDWKQHLQTYREREHSGPILDVVRVLPKDELASMAETLVNLTSFKRRVTPQAETVGGAIDVAVISKGDGFVWIKRKHYFRAELNQQFFRRYFREGDHVRQE